MGWIWVAALVVGCVSALFILDRPVPPHIGPVSWLHLLAVLTLASLWQAVGARGMRCRASPPDHAEDRFSPSALLWLSPFPDGSCSGPVRAVRHAEADAVTPSPRSGVGADQLLHRAGVAAALAGQAGGVALIRGAPGAELLPDRGLAAGRARGTGELPAASIQPAAERAARQAVRESGEFRLRLARQSRDLILFLSA